MLRPYFLVFLWALKITDLPGAHLPTAS